MQIPAKPADEIERLDDLRALNILDTSPEERFDRLTRLAKRLFGVPIALVSPPEKGSGSFIRHPKVNLTPFV